MTKEVLPSPLRALHFGAGSIGRGFIGPLLVKSGFTVIFADVNHQIIELLRSANQYSVEILSDTHTTDIIHNVDGVLSTCHEAILELLGTTGHDQISLVTTSVGPNVLPRIAPCIADGLMRRMKAGGDILNVIACENMIGASQHLKQLVFKYLRDTCTLPPSELEALCDWIENHVGWPDCAVDRIVPPFQTPEGASQLDIGVEPFFEWAFDASQIKGDTLHLEGATPVYNLPAFLERKLYTLNCAHASMAYLGFAKGYTTLSQVMSDSEIQDIVHRELLESGAALIRKHHFDPIVHTQYIDTVMKRFRNPVIQDNLSRIGRQPLRKLSPKERLVAPVNLLRMYGMERNNLLIAIAAALRYDVHDDEESVELQKQIRSDGVEAALRNVTGWCKGDEQVDEDVRFVLAAYDKHASGDGCV